MTLIKLYRTHKQAGIEGENSRALLSQAHWFSVNVTFDPKTAEALPQSLTSFLARVAQADDSERRHDRLWRITQHARASVERLARVLNENPRRGHALLPIRAVRELDANSFIKLSNRPGRTIREKLAGKPYLQAVRRYQSVDLPENRLFIVFVSRLAELLLLRQDLLSEEEDSLLPRIQSWLRTDEALAISRWDNPPPNNALLSHRDYRRVLDAWRWLQTLDDDLSRDVAQIEQRRETMRRWTEYAQLYRAGSHRFAEMPVCFDYEGFEIRPWCLEPVIQKAKPALRRSFEKKEIHRPVCVDLTLLQPRYASSTQPAALLPYTFIWQRWHKGSECVDIDLFNSDAVYVHADASSVASPDLFFSKATGADHLDVAARAFATKLRDTFKHDTLLWLVPDFLTDFDVEIIRRNLNACFPHAEPLPRSIAAVFKQVDYSTIDKDDYAIAVVDTTGGTICVTKLIARYDSDLEAVVPETCGIYWDRCPPVVIPDTGSTNRQAAGFEHLTVDSHGHWHTVAHPRKPQFIAPSPLKSNPRIGDFDLLINLTESPVAGGARLDSLQTRAGAIPLWRDRIPELSIKVIKNGRYQRFHLVSRDTTVKPIRGTSVAVPVQEDFTLPAGRPFYQFPLFLGENDYELGFSARLDSPAFPLKSDVDCRLNLTFEYGADDPYKLTFCPLDNSFPPVRATWPRTEDVVITDAPAPEYPAAMPWSELRSVPKLNGEGTSDLLDWTLSSILEMFRTTGEISHPWRIDKKGGHYTYARCSENRNVFLHENNFVEEFSFKHFGVGDVVSFGVRESFSRYSGARIAGAGFEDTPELLTAHIRKGLYFPVIQVWRDGRSISDSACPSEFADSMRQNIEYLSSLVQDDQIPEAVQNEILFLMACMHKDMPDYCVKRIIEEVEGGDIRDPQAIGFALGDMSQDWQQEVLSRLVADPTEDVLRVFAFAIWRDRHFVEQFTLSELQTILVSLNAVLSRVSAAAHLVRDAIQPLELLLGLLRTRSSKDPDILMLLQPHQRIAKELAKHVERVTDRVAKANVQIFSRVNINLHKPEGDRTPDLLYALRLYLTGDDGANAIHITSVTDGE